VKNLNEFLNDEEMDFLEAFLLDRFDEDDEPEDKDVGIMVFPQLDGYLTAIVSGPISIPPSKWMEDMWGDYPPAWKDEKEVNNMMSLLFRHMNSISHVLMNYPEEYEPIFYERESKGKTYLIVDEWCEGYLRGMKLATEEWRKGGEQIDLMLIPILAFCEEGGWSGHELEEEKSENLKKQISPCAQEIHRYWLNRRDEFMPTRQPVKRAAGHVGRNDPCPCGSGKKYKKCCLH